MEKDFLLYLLYTALIDIRERSYEEDNRTWFLCDLLHNVPYSLRTEKQTKEAYNNILEAVRHWKIENWLETRQAEFFRSFPEHKI